MKLTMRIMFTCLMGIVLSSICVAEEAIELQLDEEAGRLTVMLAGKEACGYNFAPQIDMPHLWPLRSPSGKLLTEQRPPPGHHVHHRSLWVVDRVQLEGEREVDFYHSWKSQDRPRDPTSPFKDGIRHVEFTRKLVEEGIAKLDMNQVWEIDRKTSVLDQETNLLVHPLGSGEFLIDLSFKLTANYGKVQFKSDWVHYAWPYVRMHRQFVGEEGGTITDDQGRKGQQGTDQKYAKWIDYTNTIEGVTEGLTVFSHPANGKHKWLTREYGTFGPRRKDSLSGTQFTLERGESVSGRVGILVHRGDATTGKVAERFAKYLELSK